jgi:ribosomal protein S1
LAKTPRLRYTSRFDFGGSDRAIIGWAGDDVVVDVGLKSEGVIAINEWEDRSSVDIGDEIDVFLENIESESGLIELSKRKADRIINWNAITRPARKATSSRAR